MAYSALVDNLIELSLMGAIEVTMHLTVLSKDILLNFLLEFLLSHKVVLASMHLPLPWSASGVADAQLEHFWIFFQ